LPFSPRYKFTFSGDYSHQVNDALSGFISLDAVWKSRVAYQSTTLLPTASRRTGRWVAALA
jgi:iron complex outermembrane receptor protein